MALKLNNLWGAETGGLEEISGTIGSPTVSSSVKHAAGDYSYQLPSGTSIFLDPFDANIASGGNKFIFGCWIYLTDATPASVKSLFYFDESPVNSVGSVAITTGGTVIILDANNSTVRTTGTTLSDATWYFFEFYMEYGTSGACELFIDGVSQGTNSGVDFADAGFSFALVKIGNHDSTIYVDDMYFMSGCSSSADRLGGCEVYAYRSSASGFDWEWGTALDIGTVANMQNVPFNDSTTGGYATSNEARGLAYCNDVGGSAGTGGPYTDTNITGSLKAVKGVWRGKRSGGGGTTHQGTLGNSVASPVLGVDYTYSTVFALSTSLATYRYVMSGINSPGLGPVMPDPTAGEYLSIGLVKSSGGQDWICSDMLGMVLHVPAVSVPQGIVYNPARRYAPFLVR